MTVWVLSTSRPPGQVAALMREATVCKKASETSSTLFVIWMDATRTPVDRSAVRNMIRGGGLLRSSPLPPHPAASATATSPATPAATFDVIAPAR